MQDEKQIVFIPYAGANCYDVGEEALIRANGGLNNVQTTPLWALFGVGVTIFGNNIQNRISY